MVSAERRTPIATYESASFQQLLDEVGNRLREGEGAQVIFTKGTEERVQQALLALAEHTGLSLHQVDAAQITEARGIATQGNIREVFDTTKGAPAVIFFNHADAFFEKPAAERDDDGEEQPADEDDALRLIDYLFDRMDAFAGVVVLHLADDRHVAHACERGVDAVVTGQA